MTMDDLDRMLLADEVLVPREQFAVSVMQRVRARAALARPCPFPWKTAVGGAIAFAAVAAVLVAAAMAGWSLLPPTIEARRIVDAALEAGASPIAFALLAALASFAMARLSLSVTEP
jgi:hypothetical protein